jgi:hypothetical protein
VKRFLKKDQFVLQDSAYEEHWRPRRGLEPAFNISQKCADPVEICVYRRLTQFPQECDFHDLGTIIQAEPSLDEIGRPKPPVAPDEAMAELEFL